MYIVGFNGPPHSGKDTLANALSGLVNQLHRNCKYERRVLSLPMRLVVYSLLGEHYSEPHYDTNKDAPQELLNGESIRQCMIRLSEEFVKPIYGKQFWARRLDNNLAADTQMLIISDIGFLQEPEYFEDIYGANNVLTVQLERPNTDWSKDSRGYTNGQNLLRLVNTDSLQAYSAQEILAHMLNKLGWVF